MRQKKSLFILPHFPQGHNDKEQSLNFIRKEYSWTRRTSWQQGSLKRETGRLTVSLAQVSRNPPLTVLARQSRSARIPFHSLGLTADFYRASGEDADGRNLKSRAASPGCLYTLLIGAEVLVTSPPWLGK